MSSDQYISSGILELYVAGVLTSAETEEVHTMAEKYENLAEEIKRIEEIHIRYAAVHGPELSSGFFNRLTLKIEELPLVETPVPEAKKQPKTQPLKNLDKATVVEPKAARIPQLEPQREPGRSHGRFYFVIAVSLILLALSALLNFYLYSILQSAENELIVSQKEKTAIAQQRDQLQTKYDEVYSQPAPYNAPAVKKVSLKGQAISPQAEATVYWNPQTQEVYLQVLNLPQPAEGKQYQLWAIDENDKPTDAGILTSLENSQISPMKEIAGAKAFAITLEPEEGSVNPAMDAIYAMGNI